MGDIALVSEKESFLTTMASASAAAEGADGIAVAVAGLGLGTFLGAGIPLLESSL